MPKTRGSYLTAYAIVRIDRFQDDTVALPNRIKVAKVVFGEEKAESEIRRLMEINGDKDMFYFWQATHLEPSTMVRLR